MTDPVQTVEQTQVADPATVPATVPAQVAAPAVAVSPTISTDKLRDILKLFGHDVDIIWDDAVSLAKKAL